MAYFTFVKAAFSSAVNSVITEVGANPPAALPLRHDPPGIHTVYPAAMWMRPHSTKQMQAIMAAASLTVGAGMNENEGKNENKRGAVRKKIDQRKSVVETKRMMATTRNRDKKNDGNKQARCGANEGRGLRHSYYYFIIFSYS